MSLLGALDLCCSYEVLCRIFFVAGVFGYHAKASDYTIFAIHTATMMVFNACFVRNLR